MIALYSLRVSRTCERVWGRPSTKGDTKIVFWRNCSSAGLWRCCCAFGGILVEAMELRVLWMENRLRRYWFWQGMGSGEREPLFPRNCPMDHLAALTWGRNFFLRSSTFKHIDSVSEKMMSLNIGFSLKQLSVQNQSSRPWTRFHITWSCSFSISRFLIPHPIINCWTIDDSTPLCWTNFPPNFLRSFWRLIVLIWSLISGNVEAKCSTISFRMVAASKWHWRTITLILLLAGRNC